MTAQVQGLNQAQRNANDGISVAQTAEGALNQINDNLQRVRELTVQAQNATNSPDDLSSIQSEIGQRLNEINRISEETSFNGTKVLASDQGLKIQVGANDGEAITVGLKAINASSLGLNGFNVDGGGSTVNPKATITDIKANGGLDSVAATAGGGDWGVDTNHDKATFADILSKMQSGNTVQIDKTNSGTVYTFNAESGNFTFTNEVDVDNPTKAGNFVDAQRFVPATGTKSGTYTTKGGDVTSFEVTSTGGLLVDGKAAYIAATGELTNNDPTGSASQATITDLVSETQTSSTASFTIDNVKYSGDGGGNVSFTDVATSAEVSTALAASATASEIVVGDGFATKTIGIVATSTTATSTYVDGDGDLTDLAGFRTEYDVNADTGEVTVAGVYQLVGTGKTGITGTKYDKDAGSIAYVSGGKLTTNQTTPGDATENPLATLDSALKMVDSLRSDLGAIQNRFESAITNLQTNSTNLQAARSRIEDADYAVEVANMSKNQILQQAGTSVLAQANQIPQGVLSLLR